MFKWNLFFIGLLFLFSQLSAQARRIVLLEEATNTGCGPCAMYNPGLQKFFGENFGGVISVRYHSWWPSSADPMYKANTTDAKNRINYYGINAVPTYVLDGKKYGTPSDPSAIKKQMIGQLAKGSPLKINIDSQISADSMKAKITIIGLADVDLSSLRLRTAIIERMSVYSTAPGSNKEKEFPDVMRQMLPTAAGTNISAIRNGDTLTYNFSSALKSAWNADDLAFVAWVQSDANKEVLQANIDFPTFVMDGQGSELDFLSPNSHIERPFLIKNKNKDTLEVKVHFKNPQAPNDWICQIKCSGQVYDQLKEKIAPGDSLVFALDINTSDRGSLNLTIFAENLSDPGFYGYGYGNSYLGVVAENNDILLVDDDGGASFESNFQNAFDDLNQNYVALPQGIMSEFNDQSDLNNFKLIVWNVSWGFPAFNSSDIAILKSYLDNGGSLVVMGQDVAWDIFDLNGNSNFTSARNFFRDYFDLKYVKDNSYGLKIEGVAGDPIGNGLAFDLTRPYGSSNFYPEEIDSYSGNALPVLKYNNGKTAAIRYDGGSFKTAFFGIGLEQVSGEQNQQMLLRRTLDWAAALTDLQLPAVQNPEQFELSQNYPNPFNPETKISLRIQKTAKVQLFIYNSTGELVQQLINKQLNAGGYEINWNGKTMAGHSAASGVYFYQLIADGIKLQRRMLLVR